MRITNGMISNGMLLNLNKNAKTANKYYTQMATSKKFQVASENPIAASRALRFRTNISNIEQFQKNVASAQSWMDVTDTAFANTSTIMTDRITYLLNQGANDTLALSDRQNIAEEIEDLLDQIGQNEMNANYAGRYVFSGYKTDEPPILTKDNSSTYSIEQEFSFGDIWSKMSYQKSTTDSQSILNNVNVINLAYTDIDINTLNIDPYGSPIIASTSPSDPNYNPDAYNVGDDEIRYIPETGELVFGKNKLENFMNTEIKVTYDKTGFKEGELNPKVYFNCTDITDPLNPVVYELTEDPMIYGVSIGTNIKVNSLASDVYTDKMYAVLKQFTQTLKDMTVSTRASLTAKYEGLGYAGDELEAKITEQLKDENNNIGSACHNLFNSMIEKIALFSSSVSSEHTSLGTRMNRLDMIESRLGDDNTNYTLLMSENEDTDFTEAIIKLNAAETTYQAAMQVGAKIMQLSLLNYL